MELEAIELSDFRAYREARLVLPSSGLIFLAGANNTGKSALLSALDVVNGKEDITMAQHIGSENRPEVRALFRLTDEERLRVVEPMSDRQLSNEAVTRLEWSFTDRYIPGDAFDPEPEWKMVIYRLRASGPGYPSTPLASVAWLKDPHGPYSSSGVFTLDSLVERAADQDGTSSHSRTPRLFQQHSPFSNIEELLPAQKLLIEWRSRYYHLLPLRSGTLRRTQIASSPKLTSTGDNLAAVLLDLQTNRVDLWSHLRKLLAQIIPEAGVLETPTSGEWIEISFVDPYVPAARHNIKDLGTGVEQLLMTLVVGVTQQAP